MRVKKAVAGGWAAETRGGQKTRESLKVNVVRLKFFCRKSTIRDLVKPCHAV